MANETITWVVFVVVLLPVLALTMAILYAVVILCTDKIRRQGSRQPG